MRKLVGSAVLASAVLSTAALATNGDNMIGVSPASRAMGGIGVGMPTGKTDAIFRNPAWMSAQKGFNVSFGGILFMPKVKARFTQPVDTNDTTPGGVIFPDSGYVTSDADTFTIPEVGIVNQIDDNLTVGIGAFGVSGMGVDYRNKNNLLANMHTSLQFMRIIPAISYKIMPGLSIGGAVDLAWGSLDIGATMCQPAADGDGDGVPGQPTVCWNAGGGQSQSYGIGAQIGIAYNMGDMLYAGLNYQSSVKMKYKNVFNSDSPNSAYEDLKLEQPQEVAFGLGVKPLDNLKLGLDIRWVNWSDADGYKQFKWKDQWVFALGGEYKIDKLALRAGYNYGKSPIRSGNNLNTRNQNNIPDFAAPFADFNIAWFNLIGFPAITEQHITLGAGYQFTKNFSLAVSYVHAFEKKVESTAGNGAIVVGAKNAQDSIGVGLEWSF